MPNGNHAESNQKDTVDMIAIAATPNENHGESDQESRQLAAANGGGFDQSNQVQAAAANGGGSESNQGGAQAAGVKRATHIESYEKELKDAQWWARIIGSLHALSRFVAYCNLTWATVVLLGAFASNLLSLDFAFIVCLLLLEGGRLASASFFMCLLMRPLAFRSQDPAKIDHDADGHYPRSQRARISSFMVQFTLIIPSLVLATIGHVFLDYGPKVLNLENSLRIFYSFVALNSLVAFMNLISSAQAFASLNKPPEQSILRYFDTVLQNGASFGLVRADDFEFFHFAYMMLGGEYRRNVQPKAVAKNHRKLIQYMYAHRLGMDFLQIYMNAEDAFVQLAAVNMVGFWVDKDWGGLKSEVKLPQQLLTKLADKVGVGQVGWAADNSIGVLACKAEWTETISNLCTSRGRPLLDCLVEIIDDSSSRSLSTVRTLARLYEQLCVNKEGPPERVFKEETNLVRKLRNLSKEARVHRLRVQAAYLLLMMKPKELPERSVIEAINPFEDSYWFKSEMRMLEFLLCAVDAPAFSCVHPPANFNIRGDSPISPPPYIALFKRSTPPPPQPPPVQAPPPVQPPPQPPLTS